MKRRSSRHSKNTRGMRYQYPADPKKKNQHSYFGKNHRRMAQFLIAFVVAFVLCNVIIHHVLVRSNERSSSSSSRFPIQMLRRQQQQDPVNDGRANHVRFLPLPPEEEEEQQTQTQEDKNIGSIQEDNNNNSDMIREDSLWYRSIRDKYDDRLHLSSETNNGNSHNKQRQHFAQSIRKQSYQPIDDGLFDNNRDCPLHPVSGYPKAWNTMEIIHHWNPDDTTPPHSNKIYQGICVFDYEKDYQKAMNYRNAEVPFVLRDHPQVLDTVQRWNQPGYLSELLRNEPYQTEHSTNNHFMYWNKNKYKDGKKAPKGWNPPIENIKMTFDEWENKANVEDPEKLGVDQEHWYFRLKGTDHPKNRFLYEELMFFQPVKSFFTVAPKETRGINCRFGMKGVIAENHFDGSRNWVTLLGGERRYILSHPNQCQNLALYPKEHPSGRHSAVDWSNPDITLYPQFRAAKSNEIVLQAGDALYLPTQWFHYIISLETNYQCNARSGVTFEYKEFIHDCGF